MKSDKKKASSSKWRPTLGPGFIVAAAFVGPGTVITATTAGSKYGLELIWVVGFSVFAAIVLQEMATRLGTLTGIGLGEMLRRQFPAKATIFILATLVVLAIGFGNAAYQTGNITGATLGLRHLTTLPQRTLVLAVAAIATALLWFGSYKVVERILVSAVAMMGIAFILAAIISMVNRPFNGSQWIPRFRSDSLTTVLALIGTTIVPYNLFLHASASSRRWAPVRPRDKGLRDARIDSALGIIAGGLVTVSILIASAAVSSSVVSGEASPNEGGQITSDLAESLSLVVGSRWAPILFSVGVAAAGLTSAITAPLAAAFAVCGILGWSTESKTPKFRAVWIAVIVCGVLASLAVGSSPEETIVVAQAANAVALPVIAGILLLACNAKLLSRYANNAATNAIAGAVVVFVTALSIAKLVSLFY